MPGSSTPTLRDMVKDALDSGRTYNQLAERAIDPKTHQKASLALLNDIVLNKVSRMPYDYHLRAIAMALGQPYETVRRAAIAQWLPTEDAEAETEAEREKKLMDRLDRLAAETQMLREELRRESAGERAGRRESA